MLWDKSFNIPSGNNFCIPLPHTTTLVQQPFPLRLRGLEQHGMVGSFYNPANDYVRRYSNPANEKGEQSISVEASFASTTKQSFAARHE
jgi:hypothetical protein